MKHIKLYESHIKHSSEMALNNPLNSFSRRFEDILIEMDDNNVADKKGDIKRYFIDDGTISIKYSGTFGNRLGVYMKSYYNRVKVELKFSQYEYSTISKFIDFFREKTMPYNSEDKPYKIVLYFDLSQADEVIKRIEDYHIYLIANTYNL